MQNSKIPPIAFLGVIERAALVQDGHPNLLKHNIIGLKQHIISYLFPLNIASFQFAVAIFNPQIGDNIKLSIRDGEKTEVAYFNISLQQSPTIPMPSVEDLVIKRGGQTLPFSLQGWTFLVLPAISNKILIKKPGVYAVFSEIHGEETLLGNLEFILADPEPLTQSRIAAIKSNPNATKFIRYSIECNNCRECIKAYVGIEKSVNNEKEGYFWYENLPDIFKCSCKQLEIDLTICKRNLHGFLGQPFDSSNDINLFPLYEKETLITIRNNFANLLKAKTKEESLQIFLEENPILFHQFSCEKIFFKAPILTLHKTDFAILTPNKELLLVEIEKANINLLKKGGGTHSELQHAIDQARDWLHVANEQRLAVLDCIGIERREVGTVRAIVIAGLDSEYNQEHLRRLKGSDLGHIKFMTYDDLLKNLDILIDRVSKL